MSRRCPPSRSVWLDVAGIVFLLALFLIPLGFLASEMMGGGGGLGVGPSAGSVSGGGAAPPAAPPQSGLSAWKARRSPAPSASPPSTRGGGTFGARPGAAGTSPGSTVPFSSSWRAETRPNLSMEVDPSGGWGEARSNGSYAGGTGPVDGRTEAGTAGSTSRSPSESRTRRTQTFGEGGDPSWVAEAGRAAGQARALSSELGDWNRESSQSSSEAGPASSSKTPGPRASASSDNPSLPEEPTVPIDDHLHWLLAAGVLWGVWRLGRG